MGCEGWVGVWKRTMLFKSIFKIAYGWLGLLSWQCQTFKQSKHSIHPYLLHTHYISMLLTAIWTWAGDHSKTNILDIMYISDFYNRNPGFYTEIIMRPLSWTHELTLAQKCHLAKWSLHIENHYNNNHGSNKISRQKVLKVEKSWAKDEYSWLMRKSIDVKCNWWESQLMRKLIDEKVYWMRKLIDEKVNR